MRKLADCRDERSRSCRAVDALAECRARSRKPASAIVWFSSGENGPYGPAYATNVAVAESTAIDLPTVRLARSISLSRAFAVIDRTSSPPVRGEKTSRLRTREV